MAGFRLDPQTRSGAVDAGRSQRLGALRKLGRAVAAPGGHGSRFQRTLTQLGRKIDPTDKAAVRQAASLLVSQLFFMPLLAQVRKLPFGGQVGSGGRGEEVFGEQLDQRIADIVANNTPGLTAQIESKLSQRGTRDTEPTADQADEHPREPS